MRPTTSGSAKSPTMRFGRAHANSRRAIRHRCRCMASRSPSRTTSTSRACRPRRDARRSPINPPRRRPWCRRSSTPAPSRSARRTSTSSPPGSWVHVRRMAPAGTRSIPRTSVAVLPVARRWPSRLGSRVSRWARTLPAPAGCRRPSTISWATSRRSARSAFAASCRRASRSMRCRSSRSPPKTPRRWRALS